MSSTVTIRTGSRIHLGIFSAPNPAEGSKFQGAGVMLEEPGFEIDLRFTEKRGVRYSGPDSYKKRCLSHCDYFRLRFADDRLSGIDVTVEKFIPPHHGLGSGTQYAMAIARGLSEMIDQPVRAASDLSAAVKRVSRSSVGTHGFLSGGFIIDGGRTDVLLPGSRFDRIEFPGDWRIVLITPSIAAGISGPEEVAAFQQLKPLSMVLYQRLQELLYSEIAVSVREADYECFGTAVSEFGAKVGEQFAAIQGGNYRTPQATAIVHQLQEWGVHGVGQSSWGPTLFAFMPTQEDAERLVERCEGTDCFNKCTTKIVRAKNDPAGVDVID